MKERKKAFEKSLFLLPQLLGEHRKGIRATAPTLGVKMETSSASSALAL